VHVSRFSIAPRDANLSRIRAGLRDLAEQAVHLYWLLGGAARQGLRHFQRGGGARERSRPRIAASAAGHNAERLMRKQFVGSHL
jgi:hypothetical protein